MAILPQGVVGGRLQRRPEAPVPAGGTSAALGTVPAAAAAEAGCKLGFDGHRVGRRAGLPLALPAFAAGAAFAVDGLVQQVFAARQAAMLDVAGTTAPLSFNQPFMPLLTL